MNKASHLLNITSTIQLVESKSMMDPAYIVCCIRDAWGSRCTPKAIFMHWYQIFLFIMAHSLLSRQQLKRQFNTGTLRDLNRPSSLKSWRQVTLYGRMSSPRWLKKDWPSRQIKSVEAKATPRARRIEVSSEGSRNLKPTAKAYWQKSHEFKIYLDDN